MNQFLLINSNDRTSVSTGSHDFTVNLTDGIKGVYRVCNVNIANSRYNINSTNNKVYLNYNNSGTTTLTLTPGYYTSTTIISELETQAQTIDAGFSVTYGSNTKKLTVTHSTNTFTLDFGTNTSNSAARTLGWNLANTLAATSQIGDNVLNLGLGSGIVFMINLRQSDNQIVSSSVGSDKSGCVYVPISSSYGEYTSFTSNEIPQLINFSSKTSKIDIEISDSAGNSVNLNGSDWSMLLQKVCQ